MGERICPWWLGYFLASPIRKLWQDPAKILQPFVRERMTVLEPGPGMGFFTLELARRVGRSGRVITVEVQPRMVQTLQRRLSKQGLLARVDARIVKSNTMGLEDLAGSVDLVLAFAVVHEFPEAAGFFAECSAVMKTGASLLLAEPRGHVKDVQFARELEDAARTGLQAVEHPSIPRSHAALLRKL